MKRRLLFFLYGTPNIVGSLAGLFGLTLYFTGIIGSYWYLIVAGLYAAATIGWPGNPDYHLKLDTQADIDEIATALNRLRRSLKGEVNPAIQQRVGKIVDAIQALLPRLTRLGQSDPTAYVIRETALSYLPETLENYLRLPKAYRRFHKLRDGRTPQALLMEQLDILERQMAEIVEDVHRDDLDSLKAHGRFLQTRFARSDSFLNETA